jgi:superfamily II DNA/RNA helicase
MTFKELGLDEAVIEAISYMGFEKATPIQEKAIPEIMKGKDLLACAQTGTGKTAAFILPIIHHLKSKEDSGKTSTLVIVPTRELAVQIDQQIQAFSYFVPVNSIAIYGGGDGDNWDVQKKALSSGTNIIVATPGKLLSHLQMGYVDFKHIEYLILDEADRMLDMGFIEDIQKILSYIPKKRQNLLFSATMANKIKVFARELLSDPVEISISISKPAEGVLQAAYLTFNEQKIPLLKSLIEKNTDYDSILIFSSTKKKVFDIVRALGGQKKKVFGISSDLEQAEREQVLADFKAKRTRVLVATDVLSRGIDIKDINLVVNFDVPKQAEDYVHRVGRTARAETTGVALSLVNPDDMQKFHHIEKLIEREVPKLSMPPELGEGPEWKIHSGDRKKRSSFKKDHSRNKARRPQQKK